MKRWLLVSALLASTSAQAAVTFVTPGWYQAVPIADWTSTFSGPLTTYVPHGPTEYFAVASSPVHMFTPSGDVSFVWNNIRANQDITVGSTTYTGAQALAGCVSCGLFGIDGSIVTVTGSDANDILLNGNRTPFIVGFAVPGSWPLLSGPSLGASSLATGAPELSTWAMLALGFGALFAFKRRKAAPAFQ